MYAIFFKDNQQDCLAITSSTKELNTQSLIVFSQANYRLHHFLVINRCAELLAILKQKEQNTVATQMLSSENQK
jgi:hypothetical protein